MLRNTTQAVRVPNIRTPLPGPKAAAWVARDAAVMSPSYTRPYPLVVKRGEGSTIEDVDGNLFLDFTAGIAVTATGHAHPAVVEAIREQAENLLHMSGTDFYYRAEIELAERLASLAPGRGAKRVFFTNSGAEAVEAALKLVRRHTRRPRAIAFEGAFHGRTFGALSLSRSKSVHREGFEPLVPGIHHLHYDCTRADLERLFAYECPAEEVAAIFVEPIQGEGGYRVPSAEFLPLLREVCDEHGILLVADEIQTGIGRTGRMFACEHWDVVPDLVCVAKGLASGMPLGAIVSRAELMDWPPGSHASTFGGNPVCCAAALATLDLVEREFMANAAARGDQLRIGLSHLAAETSWLAAPRGLGLMQAIDCVKVRSADSASRNEHAFADRHSEFRTPISAVPDVARRDALIQVAFERGLLLLGCGTSGIRFCPPLCITADEVATALGILHQCCAELSGNEHP